MRSFPGSPVFLHSGLLFLSSYLYFCCLNKPTMGNWPGVLWQTHHASSADAGHQAIKAPDTLVAFQSSGLVVFQSDETTDKPVPSGSPAIAECCGGRPIPAGMT